MGGHRVREVAGVTRHDDRVPGAFGGRGRALAGGDGEFAVTALYGGRLGQLQRQGELSVRLQLVIALVPGGGPGGIG